MSLRFSYAQSPSLRPVVSLDGRLKHPRPVLSVTVMGPKMSWAIDALLDTGSDETIFPDRVAAITGIDLTNAPQGTGSGVGQGKVVIRYAKVPLRIADNQEQREWEAWVGFAATGTRYPLLGFAGFLQYFSATFFGEREEVELTVNSLYPGT